MGTLKHCTNPIIGRLVGFIEQHRYLVEGDFEVPDYGNILYLYGRDRLNQDMCEELANEIQETNRANVVTFDFATGASRGTLEEFIKALTEHQEGFDLTKLYFEEAEYIDPAEKVEKGGNVGTLLIGGIVKIAMQDYVGAAQDAFAGLAPDLVTNVHQKVSDWRSRQSKNVLSTEELNFINHLKDVPEIMKLLGMDLLVMKKKAEKKQENQISIPLVVMIEKLSVLSQVQQISQLNQRKNDTSLWYDFMMQMKDIVWTICDEDVSDGADWNHVLHENRWMLRNTEMDAKRYIYRELENRGLRVEALSRGNGIS